MADRRIRTYQPRVTVLLTKVIRFQDGAAGRYLESNNRIDLTPFLSEDGQVMTHKSVAGQVGSFSLTFADRMDKNTLDTVYALISPMDHIEIRMARNPHQYIGEGKDGEMPVIMRGWVGDVKRSQTVGNDGSPMRSVVVSGHDYGKLLAIQQIFYEKTYQLGQNIITNFRLSSNYNVEARAYSAKGFVRAVLDGVINPSLKALWQNSALSSTLQAPLQILATDDDLTVPDGAVLPYSFQPYEGDLWGLLKTFADLAWNELFIRDEPDGPHMVYRPLPYKSLDGRYIAPGADPGTTLIGADRIRSIDVSRSDANLANYYWVDAPRFQMISSEVLRQSVLYRQENFFLQDYPNCAIELYGVRKMQAATQQGYTGQVNSGTNLTASAQTDSDKRLYGWVDERRARLVAYNKDNVIYESGSMEIAGDERVRAGTYLDIDYEAYRASHYVKSVTHTFVPFRQFSTRAEFVRGTGYYERTRSQEAGYLIERGRGVYG